MRRGLTLVELVLFIAVAGILSVSTGIVLSGHLQTALNSQVAIIAMNLARYELERLDSLNTSIGSFVASDLTTVTIPNYQGFDYTLTRTVSCQAGDCSSVTSTIQGVKKIVMTVTRSGSTTQLAKLVTYRTKYVVFGL